MKKTTKKYLVDTSVIAQRKLYRLAKAKLSGMLLIPHAVIAELENLANHGNDVGFHGLEEIAKLHHIKKIKIIFIGERPNQHQIKYARSGEIDALIRSLAVKNRATLITADKVQCKSAQAFNIPVIFIKTIAKKEKRKFSFPFFKKRKSYK